MNNNLILKNLPDSEKPMEKFLSFGVKSLSDAELLALILRTGCDGKTAINLAEEILSPDNGNLLNLYSLSYEQLKDKRGMGPVKACQLKVVAELSSRINCERYKSSLVLNDPSSVADFAYEKLRHKAYECIYVIFLNAKAKLIKDEIITEGQVSSSKIYARKIFERGFELNASQFVLLHNHPSGDCTPSKEDDDATEAMYRLGITLDMPLLDHIIIGDRLFFSYKNNLKIIH